MPCNKKKRYKLYCLCKKQKYKCYYCERKIIPNRSGDGKIYPFTATVDHFIPISKGGTNTRENLVASCHNCNEKKNDAMPSLFLSSGRSADFRF